MTILWLLLSVLAAFSTCQGSDDWQWTHRNSLFAPDPREGAGIVWTGKEVLISHGYDGDVRGGRYEPAQDTWRAMSISNAPTSRAYQSAIWTGKRLIVWGGFGGGGVGPLNTGGIYDPETDTWKPTSLDDAPSHRHDHVAVWTGTEMIIWGGRQNTRSLRDGARYNPKTDRWTAMSSEQAPSARAFAGAVWTGYEMIVWGGEFFTGASGEGGKYNPTTDSWTPTSLINVPPNKVNFVTVWTGSEMLVWGGGGPGGRYDPLKDTWASMNTNGMPPTAWYSSGVWSGKEMIVWGGQDSSLRNEGARFNPTTDTWTSITTNGVPSPRHGASAVWIGDAMLFFGGWAGGNFYNNELWSYQPGNVYAGDGLSDQWQQNFFGDTWSPNAMPDADPDEDGQSNHYEFTTGTNPTTATSLLAVSAHLVNSQPQVKLSGLAFDRQVEVFWTSDLANPSFQPLTSFGVSTQDQAIVIADLDPVTNSRFYKVSVKRRD